MHGHLNVKLYNFKWQHDMAKLQYQNQAQLEY